MTTEELIEQNKDLKKKARIALTQNMEAVRPLMKEIIGLTDEINKLSRGIETFVLFAGLEKLSLQIYTYETTTWRNWCEVRPNDCNEFELKCLLNNMIIFLKGVLEDKEANREPTI